MPHGALSAGSAALQRPAQRLLACSLCSNRGRTARSVARTYPPELCTHTCCTAISGMPGMTSARACSIVQWVLRRPRSLHWPQARRRRLQRRSCPLRPCCRPNPCRPAPRQRQRRRCRRWPMTCRRPPTIHRRQHTRCRRRSVEQALQPRATRRMPRARLRGPRVVLRHRLAASAPPAQRAALDSRLPF